VIRDSTDLTAASILRSEGQNGAFTCLTFSADGTRIAAGQLVGSQVHPLEKKSGMMVGRQRNVPCEPEMQLESLVREGFCFNAKS
jgi:hypothetical protein